MGWQRIPGLKGKLYVPDIKPEMPKKHPCTDCHACQQCGNDRCHVCRSDSDKNDLKYDGSIQ